MASNPEPVVHQQTTRESVPGGGEGQVPGPETLPVPLLLVRWHPVLRPVQAVATPLRGESLSRPPRGLDTASPQRRGGPRGAGGGYTA